MTEAWKSMDKELTKNKEYEGTLAQRQILQKAAIERKQPFDKTKSEK